MWGEERPTLLKRPKERLAVFRDRSFGSYHLRLSSAVKSSTFRSRHLISALCVLVLTLLSSLQAHAQTTYEKEKASGEMYDEARLTTNEARPSEPHDSTAIDNSSKRPKPTALMQLIMDGNVHMIYVPPNAIPAKRPEIEK